VNARRRDGRSSAVPAGIRPASGGIGPASCKLVHHLEIERVN
jgi:hypothetical protein